MKLIARALLTAATLASLVSATVPTRAQKLAGQPPTVTLNLEVRQAYQRRPSRDAVKWADEQLKAMTLEEKTGQLISVGVNARFLNQESESSRSCADRSSRTTSAASSSSAAPSTSPSISSTACSSSRERPLLISADLEAGAGMRFEDTVNLPWNMAVGATGNPEYARRQGEHDRARGARHGRPTGLRARRRR